MNTDRNVAIPAFLSGGGEAGELMRSRDWSTSPLGDPGTWPQSLRTVVDLMLHSKFPMFVAWGPELGFLYNDPYVDILGAKHPAAMGARFKEVWAEIWHDLLPMIERALAGEATYHDNLPLLMRRKGYDEPTWFTFSYSPVHDESGKVAGMFCACTETTAQVLAERYRAEELERLRGMFEQAPGFMVLLRGPEHVFELVNAAYYKVTGPRPLLGKPVREALPEVAGQGFYELLDRVYATGEPYVGRAMAINLHRTPGGAREQRFLNFIYQPIRDAAGQVTGIFIEGSDVTESVKATAALRESEARLRQLANTIPQLAWIADPDGAVHWYNDRWYEYTGTTFDQVKGWGWQSLHDPEFLPRFAQEWKEALAKGSSIQMTFPLRGADGRYRHFYTSVAPLHDASGRIVQWFGTNTDITPLLEAQQALSESEERLQQGLRAARMVVWEWDLATGGLEYSSNAAEVFGQAWNSEEPVWEAMHPDDLPQARAAVKHAIDTNGHYDVVVRMTRPDNGETIWIDFEGRVIADASGKATRVKGIALDVTQRRRAEEELRIANRRKDEFLAMLAHELRNPLAPISAAARLLKMNRLDEARMRRTSEIISRQVDHMTKLVDDLLDVSRVTRGLVTLDRQTIDLNEVVADAVEQVHPLLDARRHQLTVQTSGRPMMMEGDRTRLVQVFTNILNNAAKYTPPGGAITLRMGMENGQAEIGVRDNGIGIPGELLPYVFDLFTQAERSPDRSQGGLGLGLALVRSLVELHGGSVAAKSEGAGKGSEFIIRLPLLAQAADENTEQQDNAGSGGSNRALRLMIVDDNADAAQTLAILLEMDEHKVSVEYDARSALERAPLERPQVLLLDIGLPDMDGYELVRRLRQMPETAQAVFIALTGYGQEQDRGRSKDAGFDHHLVKPVDTARLARLIADIASAKHAAGKNT